MSKASESIRKIQEAARQRVLERVGKGGSPKPTPKISGELVCVKAAELEKKVISQIHSALAHDFDDLKHAIVTLRKIDDPPVDIAPNNCRFIFQNSNGHSNAGIMILEFPPTTRIVNAYCTRKNERKSFNIPFPYFYFIIHFSKLISKNGTVTFAIGQRGVGARTLPLKSLSDKIGCIPIPHTQGLHFICQSETNARRSYNSLQDLATDVVNTFWRTEFVHEFIPFIVDKKEINSWSDWEELSALDMLKVVLQSQSAVQTLIQPIVSGWLAGFGQNNPLCGQIQNLVAHTERKLRAKINSFNFTKDIAKAMREIQDSE